MLVMSRYDPAADAYSDYVFETVCVAGSVLQFERLDSGSTSPLAMRWTGSVYGPEGGIIGPVFNTLDEAPAATLSIRDAVIESFSHEGRLCEWLRLLDMKHGSNFWRLSPYTTPDFLFVDDG
jgi:hypothetical protein